MGLVEEVLIASTPMTLHSLQLANQNVEFFVDKVLGQDKQMAIFHRTLQLRVPIQV